MSLIGTKWKPLILFHLLDGGLRSGLKKISGISNKMFTQTVRELEKTALFPEKFSGSSKVEYKLTREEDRLKIF
jgi:DNA-binding HxlR family transcriptional regulator